MYISCCFYKPWLPIIIEKEMHTYRKFKSNKTKTAERHFTRPCDTNKNIRTYSSCPNFLFIPETRPRPGTSVIPSI